MVVASGRRPLKNSILAPVIVTWNSTARALRDGFIGTATPPAHNTA